jgi:protocatechuate 3,4-dioxygenase beta subunit
MGTALKIAYSELTDILKAHFTNGLTPMKNNRRDFLKLSGIVGAASMIPFRKSIAEPSMALNSRAACTLIPSETAGPFPLDLTANTAFLRQDIRESKTGVPLNLKLKILGVADCAPMANVRVNIWQCDKDGNYSGYDNGMNPGQAGQTYLRGYQVADTNGEVNFVTVFPGWYNGRICHIHFQVYVSSSYAAISQLTFDITAKNLLYAANPTLYLKGADPTTLAGDNVFANGYAVQIATLTPNPNSGGYDSYMEVSINGSGSTGIGHIEMENAKQFTLGQAFFNPKFGKTAIPFSLNQSSNVLLRIFDLSGQELLSISKQKLHAGQHEIEVELNSIGNGPTHFLYQLEVSNGAGKFKQFKLMTAYRP